MTSSPPAPPGTNDQLSPIRSSRPLTCSGRRRSTTSCTRAAILAKRIERKIEQAYATKSLTAEQAAATGTILHDVFNHLEGSTKDERTALTEQQAKLEAERLKLVQAHYADAIPVDLLKTEQDRIHNALTAIQTRLDSLHTRYADARVGLDEMLGLLTDLHDLYMKCEPTERRFLNQAIFTKIIVNEDENVTLDTTLAVNTVISQHTAPRITRFPAETKKPRVQAGQLSTFELYVDPGRIELPTSCLQSRHSTN